MPAKPALRIDLGDLDPHFERFAASKGQSVSEALGNVLTAFLDSAQAPDSSSQKRIFRTVNFTSEEERQDARKRARAMRLPLGAALRKVAMEQISVRIGENSKTSTAAQGVPSVGVLSAIGVGETASFRVELRLTASEMSVLEGRAKAGRYRSVQAMIIAITRAYLANAPVLDHGQAAALGRENLELVRISNFVAQLLRDVDGGKRLGLLEAAEVVAMLGQVEAYTQTVGKALASAQGRWTIQEEEQEARHGNDR